MSRAAPAAAVSRPSHGEITAFVSGILPPLPADVAFLYHVPRHRSYVPDQAPVTNLVLSVTPTAGFYAAIAASPPETDPLCFLHRPWALERRRLPSNALVLASHKAFDEVLTVGWNPTLAARLGFSVDPETRCVRGYKGDPERKIGLVARSSRPGGVPLDDVAAEIRREYGGEGELFAHGSSRIEALAIMNAFHAAEVERAVRAAGELNRGSDPGSTTLYLTGQVREAGLEAAKALGMPVVCVGHRACEEWGIRFLGSALRLRFPGVSVQEILEPEEPRVYPERSTTVQQIKAPD